MRQALCPGGSPQHHSFNGGNSMSRNSGLGAGAGNSPHHSFNRNSTINDPGGDYFNQGDPRQGGGVENKHSTDAESPPPPPRFVRKYEHSPRR